MPRLLCPRTHPLTVGLAGVLLGLCACGPDLTSSSEVVRPRIMAARVEVEGEPERSNPKPGEVGLLRLQVGFPKKPPPSRPSNAPLLDLGAAFCLTIRLPNGDPYCLMELPDTVVQPELVTTGPDELAVRFQVPDLDALDLSEFADLLEDQDLFLESSELPDLMLLGSVCVQGEAVRERGAQINETPLTRVFRCDPRREGDELAYPYVIAFYKTLVQLDLDNRNPDMACDADAEAHACRGKPGQEQEDPADIVLVRPRPENASPEAPREVLRWPPPPTDLADGPFTGCANDMRLLKYGVGEGDYRIRLRFDENDREKLPDDPDRSPDLPDVEELRIYAAHTEGGGTLDATLRLVAADVPGDAMEVEYELEPPRKVEDVDLSLPPEGRIIRFYFAVLDGRGGADFTTRALCLLPPD